MRTLKIIILNLLILAISLLAIVVAGRIDAFLGFRSFQSPLSLAIGTLCVSAGFFLRSWASYTFYRHHLRVLELRAQHVLLKSGPYEYSRNPLYVSVVAVVLGCALLLGSFTGVLFALLSCLSWRTWVRLVEEQSLEEKFGKAYREYKQRVPRWFDFRRNRSSMAKPPSVWFASALLTVLLLMTVPFLMGGAFILINCPQQETTTSIEDHTDQSSGLLVYYRTAGDPAKQPVVFLHGWGARTDGRCGIDGVIQALVDADFFVVAPEHPGLNRSDTPQALWSYGEYADALHTLLKPLRLHQPIIMGQSFGGGIASAYAERYGNNVRSLILIDAVVSGRPVTFAMRMKHRWDNLAHNVLTSPSLPLSLKKRMVRLYLGVPSDIIDAERVVDGAQMPLIDKHTKPCIA